MRLAPRAYELAVCVVGFVALAAWSAAARADNAPQLTLAAGGGTTQRVVEFTRMEGPERLDTGWVPALGVELRAAFPSDTVVFGFEAEYATSLNAEGAQHPPSPESPAQLTALRSHRFAIGARAGLGLGDHGRGVQVSALLGYGLRALASVGQLEVPRFTMHGPLLRLELELPVVPERLVVRLAPQAELLVSVTKALRRLAETESNGYALGGEVSIELRIWQWLVAELQYHESHAIVDSELSSDLTDIERVLLLSARLQL